MIASMISTRLLLTAAWFLPLAAIAQTAGPLRVHAENPRYFADASGKEVGAEMMKPNLDYDPSVKPAKKKKKKEVVE